MTELSIGMVNFKIAVPAEGGRHRGPGPAGEVQIEMWREDWRVWTEELCGERFDLATSPRPTPMSRPLHELPHFAAILTALSAELSRHRNDPLGDFLRPAVEAMERVLAERQGASVYFAGAGDRIKIGWSRKVATRIAQLQTGNSDPIRLLGLIPGARAKERELHEQFAHARLVGEWFSATPDLLAYIDSIA